MYAYLFDNKKNRNNWNDDTDADDNAQLEVLDDSDNDGMLVQRKLLPNLEYLRSICLLCTSCTG